jgi:FixJ family two-component response regulator
MQHHLPRVPLVLMTAFGDAQMHQRAASLGAMVVLNKPFNLLDFCHVVRSAVESSRAEGP